MFASSASHPFPYGAATDVEDATIYPTQSSDTLNHHRSTFALLMERIRDLESTLEDEREALVTAEVTRERIEDVRSFLPVLENRRTDVL